VRVCVRERERERERDSNARAAAAFCPQVSSTSLQLLLQVYYRPNPDVSASSEWAMKNHNQGSCIPNSQKSHDSAFTSTVLSKRCVMTWSQVPRREARRGGVLAPSHGPRWFSHTMPGAPCACGAPRMRTGAENGSPPGRRAQAPGAPPRMLARLPRPVRAPESSDSQTVALLE
jgi:hypothetical protein